MENARVQDLNLKGIVSMFKKTLLSVAISGLVGCASGGGSSGVATQPVASTTASSTTTTQTTTVVANDDNRHSFESRTIEYSPNIVGYSNTVTHSLTMTDYTENGLPSPTEKYKIADYGFLQSTINGNHAGYDADEESSILNSFIQRGQVKRADLNGDGWQDFYMVLWAGDHIALEFAPKSTLLAFVNDGDGNFILRDDLFPAGNPCLVGSDTDCNVAEHRRFLVADFNNDGVDDLYQGTTLVLSDNGSLYDKRDTHLPLDMFADCHGGKNCFLHDAYAADSDNDGDKDIFLPFWSHRTDNSNMPWAMLINDGTGKFSANQNFPDQAAKVFATTAVVGDFDNDGHGDVAVGWMKPQDAKIHGFSENYENSAGAVFWNDGANDWRNRGWSELPDNYYGANGNANDVEAFDFNGDGLLDIVLASTKHEPYYDGRMVQFFVNNGDNTFSDVTAQYNPNTKYADGIKPVNGYWNGDGELEILDFDADGDLDIVDTVRGTYALINENGKFTLYDDFPRFYDNNVYYPIEIDNKYFYDFIGSTVESTDDQSVATFFQVLDPPFAEMLQDITTKPSGYLDTIFNTSLVLQDIRYQTRGSKIFGQRVNSSNIVGFNVENNVTGFAAGNITGDIDGYFLSVDYNNDTWRSGVTFVSADTSGTSDTVWYGTGSADIRFSTLTTYVENAYTLTSDISAIVGAELQTISVDKFTETNSDFNATINGFDMNLGKVFADINARFVTDFGQTHVVAGVDYYHTLDNVSVQFADVLEYNYANSNTVGRISVAHQVNNLYIKLSADTENNESIEIGFTFWLN